ncbi:MAG: hypothetical protein BHW37_02250 [Firmicutes bacterium CAG:272_52_7]|nr:MAG: hypothetical protein BHW37_02250 [Firmicutes bacterium CAG:272_52_7]
MCISAGLNRGVHAVKEAYRLFYELRMAGRLSAGEGHSAVLKKAPVLHYPCCKAFRGHLLAHCSYAVVRADLKAHSESPAFRMAALSFA